MMTTIRNHIKRFRARRIANAWARRKITPIANEWAKLNVSPLRDENDRLVLTNDLYMPDPDSVQLCGCALTTLACDITPPLQDRLIKGLLHVNGYEGGEPLHTEVNTLVIQSLKDAGYESALLAGVIAGYDGGSLPNLDPRWDLVFTGDDGQGRYHFSHTMAGDSKQGITLAEYEQQARAYTIGFEIGAEARELYLAYVSA